MYKSVLSNIKNVLTCLKNQEIYETAGLSFPALTLNIQKPFKNYCSVNLFCNSVSAAIEKNPLKRKELIDKTAQLKLEALIANNPELQNKLKVLELEMDVMRQEGARVPSNLRPRDLLELVQLKNRHQRRKFLDYKFVAEVRRNKSKNDQEEGLIRRERIRSERFSIQENGGLVYNIGHNFMLRRIVDGTMNDLWNWNSLKAIMYGNKLVFDCSYEKYMNSIELKSCAKQIQESYSTNRHHNHPFEIFLCNVNFSGHLIEKLSHSIPTIFDDDFPMTITSKSYFELFEKPKLVYLTADAPAMLEKYDPDSIYIIGAFVDKHIKRSISLAKAKEQKLRMARLPLDKYIQFGEGSGKNLTLDQVCGIMLDAQVSDWKTAMLHVPRRKLYESRLFALERRVEHEKQNILRRIKLPTIEIQSNKVQDYSHAARMKFSKKVE